MDAAEPPPRASGASQHQRAREACPRPTSSGERGLPDRHSIRYRLGVDAAAHLRRARLAAGLSQRALAARAGTSQAAVAAYERGHKDPGASTFIRLLAAAGGRLDVVDDRSADDRLGEVGRVLVDVIRLAAALPVRHGPELRFPRVPVRPLR